MLALSILLRPLNHVLEASPWARERLQRHAGAGVQITAGGLQWLLQIDSHGVFRAMDGDAVADVCISLPDDFVSRFLVDRSSLLAHARLTGSADIAETLAFVFRNLRWDVEADLASVFGDIVARRLALLGRKGLHEGQRAALGVGQNFAEYATEEAGLVASRQVIADFSRDVDTLRDDLARLEKRVGRLSG